MWFDTGGLDFSHSRGIDFTIGFTSDKRTLSCAVSTQFLLGFSLQILKSRPRQYGTYLMFENKQLLFPGMPLVQTMGHFLGE